MEVPLELNRYLLTLKYKETLLRTIHSGTFSSSDLYPFINRPVSGSFAGVRLPSGR